jgi:hypothetical protein
MFISETVCSLPYDSMIENHFIELECNVTYTEDVKVAIDCRLNSTTEFNNVSYDLARSEGLVVYRQRIGLLVTAAMEGDWFTCHVHVTSSPNAAMLSESNQQNCAAAQNFTTVWHSKPITIVTKNDESPSKSACPFVKS